jgi:hypothetical protein
MVSVPAANPSHLSQTPAAGPTVTPNLKSTRYLAPAVSQSHLSQTPAAGPAVTPNLKSTLLLL